MPVNTSATNEHGLDDARFAAAASTLVRKHFAHPARYAEWLQEQFAADADVRAQHASVKYGDPGYRISSNAWAREAYTREAQRKGLPLLMHGDDSLVPEARKLINSLTAKLPTVRSLWQLDIAGAYANVPAALSGSPASMMRYTRKPNDNTPVRIWVNVLPSGACTTTQLLRRGAVLSALALLLSKRRSIVRITPYADQPAYDKRGVVLSWDLPTAPISLAQWCASLGQPDLVRNTSMYAAACLNATVDGGWLRGHCPGYRYDERQVRADLGAKPDDVVIPALFAHDKLINEPLAWLNAELERILGAAALR